MSNLKIFTENIEYEALNQIYTLVKQPAFADCKIRIMPDVHAGAGCVIGFTADLGDKVIPNIVGVDIGCGMLTVELGTANIDYAELDRIIRENIPSGRSVRDAVLVDFPEFHDLRCWNRLREKDWLERSMGSLGGGNHFVEVDEDEEGNKYLVIHTGSRNLGKQVAMLYQAMAIKSIHGDQNLASKQAELIARYKAQKREKEIQQALAELNRTYQPVLRGIPKELCYLTGQNREDYLHDMQICQRFAVLNRYTIANTIVKKLFGVDIRHCHFHTFETIHNYIEQSTNMVRKGAISAKKGERVLIPINMRDGCIIGIGKGNEDWNCSAPHGAGRLMSRSQAKEQISMEDYEESMKGIYTTSVNSATLDESPMAYKSIDEILANIADTIEVEKIIRPVYNFKASEKGA